MQTILTCIQEAHDRQLLLMAALVCMVGVAGAFSVARHAAKSTGRRRRFLAATGIVAAGCTAWATHMIALLAFSPGMPAGFEPILTTLSLFLSISGIAGGMALTIGQHERKPRLIGGSVLGMGIVALHYVGQAGYVVRGFVTYDSIFVGASIGLSLPLFALALCAAGEKSKRIRLLGAPLLLTAIAVLHLSGMAALHLRFDPRVEFPSLTLAPDVVAPIVAAVSAGIFAVAILGLWLTLHAQATLRRERQRLGELANLGLEGLAICDGDIIVAANESLERLTGQSRKDLVGRSLAALIDGFDIAALPIRQEADAKLVSASGKVVPIRVIRSDIRLGLRSQTVVAFRDQRERLRSEEKIRTLAFSDHLTGLANRTRFLECLSESVECAREGGSGFAVLLIDLDGFKSINDALGHHVGDQVLTLVADRLRTIEDAQHIAARFGGDEFAILARGGADPLRTQALGVRIIEILEEPIHVSDQIIHVSASIGGVLSSDRCLDTTRALENADLALYDAKGRGSGIVRLFTQELRQAAIERSGLILELRDAWESNELELYYQPQVRLADSAIVGAEALIRWNYPYRGVLAPSVFLSALESSTLAVPVGTWILEQACRQAKAWRNAGLADFRIGVNLFAEQLRAPDFVEVVQRILTESGLPADALEIEVTENIVLKNESVTLAHLANLRRLGVKIAFDDFGTGYASLTMLKRIEIDRLKIDRSFVRHVDTDAIDQAIVDAISRMAQACKLEVIAEGIETEVQASFMKDYAAEAQGYHFGRPMRAAEFEKRLLPLAGLIPLLPDDRKRAGFPGDRLV